MEPVTMIVSAVALGAVAGLQESAMAAVKDAYVTLKQLISERYREVDVVPVEEAPDSEAERRNLGEDLTTAGAETDLELLDAARRVIDEVRNYRPSVSAAVGIDLEHIEAATLQIGSVESQGIGIRVRQGKFSGDINIENVRVDQERSDRP